MIEFFRRFSNSLGVKIFLGLLALCFVFLWGGHDGLRMIGLQKDYSIATIGGTRIPMHDFQVEIQRELIRMKLQTGADIQEKEALAMGMHQAILQRMISQKLVTKEVEHLGIVVSENFLAKLVKQNALFLDTNKQFSKERFDYIIPRLGFRGESDYVNTLRRDLTNLRFITALTLPTTIPQKYIDRLLAWNLETRTVDGIIIRPRSLTLTEQPTEQDLRNYYGKNQRQFQSPERRSFTALIIPKAQLTQGLKPIAQEDVQAIYQAQKASTYKNTNEADAKKAIQENLDKERLAGKAAEFADRIEKAFHEGQSLAKIAVQEKLEIRTYKDRVAPETVSDKPDLETILLQTAYQQDEGALSPLDSDQKDTHFMILVDQIQAPKQLTFAEALGDIRNALVEQKQLEAARKLADDMLKALKGGATLASLAQQHRQDTFHISLSRTEPATHTTLTITPDVAAEVFKLRAGQATLLPHVTKKRELEILVTKLTKIEPGNIKGLSAEKKQEFQKALQSQMSNDLIDSLLHQLEQKARVEVNQKLLKDYVMALSKEKKEG